MNIKKKRKKRTKKGEEQTDINTDRKTDLQKNAREWKRDDNFEEEDINTVMIMFEGKN